MLKQQSPKITDTYEAFILDRKSQRFKSSTLRTYTARLLPFVNWCESNKYLRISDINPTVIRTYLSQLQDRKLAGHTIHGIAICIQTFFNWCASEEIVKESPMKKVSIPKTDKKILPSLAEGDIQKLLKNVKTERDEAIILVLLDTGLRATEFINLVGRDIDMKTGTLHVQAGKGGKDRIIYIGNRTLKQLARYYMVRGRPKDEDRIWLNERTGEPLTDMGLRQFLKKLGNRVGVKNCTPHSFRRAFCIMSLRSGMSIYHLQKLMGHAGIEVLKQYLALVQDDLQKAHEQHGIVDNL